MLRKDAAPEAPGLLADGPAEDLPFQRMRVSPRRLFRGLVALVVLGLLAASVAGGRGLPAKDGIGNFGQVSSLLYRGSQPDEMAMKSLQKLGVKLVINLCMPDEAWKSEAAEAQADGILYTNIPLRGIGRPTDSQMKQILNLIDGASGPVFIHCKHGCDRTGTVVACYRIRHDHWANDDALREAEHYGLSRFERSMRRFIAGFDKALPLPLTQESVAKARS